MKSTRTANCRVQVHRWQLLAALREVQPDELSPKEALERLYQLKKLM